MSDKSVFGVDTADDTSVVSSYPNAKAMVVDRLVEDLNDPLPGNTGFNIRAAYRPEDGTLIPFPEYSPDVVEVDIDVSITGRVRERYNPAV